MIILYEIESGDIDSLSQIDLNKIAKVLNVKVIELTGDSTNHDIEIYKSIKYIYREFGINKDTLTTTEKHSIATSLESAINILKNKR